jgi:hypothetical protein
MINTILVQLADEAWTLQAIHLASALARNCDAKLVLLRLIPVRHLGYLGSDIGNMPVTDDEYARLRSYAATAEDYGVELIVASMQCVAALDAVAEAADQLDAQVVFARVPESRIPYWHQYQIWRLERRLKRRTLYTLQNPPRISDWAPHITVKAPEKVNP